MALRSASGHYMSLWPVIRVIIQITMLYLIHIGRGQRRHRDKSTGSIPDIFLILLDMKKLSSANQSGCNKDQSCQKFLTLVEK